MSENKEIEIMESIYEKNEQIAKQLNEKFTKDCVFAINVMGAPGAGKTSLITQIISRLSAECYVIEGDIESDIDTKKLISLGIKATQINTNGACHLDSPLILKAAHELNVKNGVLFIENIGNLVCPAEFEIGEHIKLLVSTATEGSDKPYKYPLAFENADIIIINKADLIAHVDFDEDFYVKGVRALNKNCPIFKVSSKTGQGIDEVVLWLKSKII